MADDIIPNLRSTIAELSLIKGAAHAGRKRCTKDIDSNAICEVNPILRTTGRGQVVKSSGVSIGIKFPASEPSGPQPGFFDQGSTPVLRTVFRDRTRTVA